MKRYTLLDESHKIGFLIDECVGFPTANLLRELGYSVITANDALLNGEPDSEILRQAIKEKRILVTEDIEFGNIILYPPKTHYGIILLRFRHRSENEIHAVMKIALAEIQPDEFKGTLIVIDADKYRIRR
jgi:predicted nuclease of predicted toxin-antitoxin system